MPLSLSIVGDCYSAFKATICIKDGVVVLAFCWARCTANVHPAGQGLAQAKALPLTRLWRQLVAGRLIESARRTLRSVVPPGYVSCLADASR